MPREPELSPPRTRGRGTLLTTLGVLAALAVVAVASRGSIPTGDPGVGRPSETLLDVLVSLYVVALGLGFALFLYMLALRRHVRGSGGERRRLTALSVLAALALLVVVVALLRRLGIVEPQLTLPEVLQQAPPAQGEPAPPPREPRAYEAEFAWVPMLVLAALAAAAGLAWWLSARARRRARSGEDERPFAEALADVLEKSLDDLRAEPDPRKAVIRAYGRLERAAAASGVARRAAEAPLEYLARLLAGLEVGPAAVQRLTALFERARFSQHEVDARMKLEAIAALESVLEDLRQAEARARQAREEALELARERLLERVRA